MKRKTDAQIKHDVSKELLWDTRTWNQGVIVDVEDAVVTLTGSVSTYAQKIAAQLAAHRVNGVLDVVNELSVRVKERHTDDQIAHAVREALEWGAFVPDKQIKSHVSNGWVRLEGRVNSLSERSDAEWVVSHLNGVAGVINEIEINATETDATVLRHNIAAALERRADREAERLRIDIKDGVVSLYGRVHSWPEREAVVGSISHAPGVHKVVDNLRIDPYF